MLSGWVAVGIFLVYLGVLLALAFWGDRSGRGSTSAFRRRAVYALCACVYCSAWSLCGSVGMASRNGIDVLPMYIGPMLAFVLFHPAIGRMIRLAKSQNVTSVSDFMAVRYGKSTAVAATVSVIASLASIPYIAVQIRAIAQSLAVFVDGRLPQPDGAGALPVAAMLVTIVLVALTIVIGTRRVDATEHQSGLMLVIAFESIIKLVAIVGVGAFVCWGMFKGVGDLTEVVDTNPTIGGIIDKSPDVSMWIALTLTTMAAVFFLPHMFHALTVENRQENDVQTAAWFVPLYLVAISLFVLPLAVAGLATFPHHGMIDRDFTILALPIQADSKAFAALALIGNISASTSTVLVVATTLSVMIPNDLVVPFLLRIQSRRLAHDKRGAPIMALRRLTIVLILASALVFVEAVPQAPLHLVGILALAGIAQIAPAAIGGLVWRRGNARGAVGGTIAGTLVMAYTLILPAISRSSAVVTVGPLGFDALRPTDLFGLDLAPFAQAMMWSLLTNSLVYCAFSLSRLAAPNERLQADRFIGPSRMSFATSFRIRHTSISAEELLTAVSRYIDPVGARRLFLDWHKARGVTFDKVTEADGALIQYAEHLIASSIGAASSRLVITLLLQKREMSVATARQIVDDAAFEIQNSRDILQHAIDVAHDGMAVYDADLRLVAWNRAYRDMFQFPPELMRVGTPLDALVRSNAERGVYGQGPVDDFVGSRLEALTRPTEGSRLYSAPFGRVLEMRSVRLHNGGLFFTYTDATAQVTSEEELEAENLTLERRVRERTEELENLNVELIRAKAEAEDANVSKSRFLAAASHDLLQPLSAARLYTTSLRERLRLLALGDATAMLAANVDSSLEAVEDILGALLEISHLDAGATRTEITSFGIGDMLRQLQMEFEPLARERGLRLRFAPSTLRVKSDRRLLRRMLQNLISNAIKYTPEGRVVIGARRCGEAVRFEVYDTGIGIPESKQTLVFREFERLPAAVEASSGVGLGLSIVERLSRVLKHDITLRSRPGKGTIFSVLVPRAEATLVTLSGTSATAPVRQRSLDGLTVAAIDNEQHILSAMALLLQGWDCIVASGTGLPEIETSIDGLGRGPDVIVADYHIGEIDGLEVIATLRKRHGSCPAVLVTADRSPVIKDLAHVADVRVLHKPLKPAALRALLSQWHLVKAAAE